MKLVIVIETMGPTCSRNIGEHGASVTIETKKQQQQQQQQVAARFNDTRFEMSRNEQRFNVVILNLKPPDPETQNVQAPKANERMT